MAAFADLAAEIAAELELEFETHLIVAVKSSRCLYATDHPDYHNMQQNKIAWLKISSSLKKTVAECMNKWYTLLQIFLHHYRKECNNEVSANDIMWPHYNSLKDMQKYISENYSELIQLRPPLLYSKPNAIQKDLLFREMLNNRVKLVAHDTPTQLRRQIWAQIVDNLNSIPQGAQMPIIKWQKYWWDTKQNVGVLRSRIRMKLQAMGTKLDVAKYSEEDLKILQFCGVMPADNPAVINIALSNDIEFGCDGDQVVRKCRKCTIPLNELMVDDYCDTCRKIPKTLCDICSKRHEQGLIVYQVKNWSVYARNLLPASFYSYAEVSMCTMCSSDLKIKATMFWKACRVCEKHSVNLDTLYSTANDYLRRVFRDATNVTFSENDGLPGYICKICKVQMQQFNNFYLRFSRAQCRLRQVHLAVFVPSPTTPNSRVKSQPLPQPKPQPSSQQNNVMILNTGQNNKIFPIIDITGQHQAQLQPNLETPHYIPASKSMLTGPVAVPQKPTTIRRVINTPTGQKIITTRVANNKAVVQKRVIPQQKQGNSFTPDSTIYTPHISQNTGAPAVKRICMTSETNIPMQQNHSLQTTSSMNVVGATSRLSSYSMQLGPGNKSPMPPIITTQKGVCTLPLGQPGSGSPMPMNNLAIRGVCSLAPGSANAPLNNGAQRIIPLPTNTGLTVTKRVYTGLLNATSSVSSTYTNCSSPVSVIHSNTANMGAQILPTSTLTPPIPHNVGTATGVNTFSPATQSQQIISPIPGTVRVNKPPQTKPGSTTPNTQQFRSICTTQPAGFTVSGEPVDYEQQEDTLPAFCIPKSGQPVQSSILSPGQNGVRNGDKIVTISSATTQSQPTIKNETIDKDYPDELLQSEKSSNLVQINNSNTNTPLLQPKNDPEVSSNASTISVETAVQEEIPAVLPLPGTSTGVTPSTSNKASCQSKVTSSRIQIHPSEKPKTKTQADTTPQIRKGGPVSKSKLHPQQTQTTTPAIAPGNKKPRKYWGAIDEFQITSSSDKAGVSSNMTQRPQVNVNQNAATQNKCMPANGVNNPTTNNSPPNITDVVVKTELIDKDDESSVQVENVDSNPSMFYPDSFELGKVCLDANMSLMITDFMKKEAMSENMKLDSESFKYLEPSFLLSYVRSENLAKELLAKQTETGKETDKTLTNHVEVRKTTSTPLKHVNPISTIKMKKVRVKVARDKRLRTLFRRKKIYFPLKSSTQIRTRHSLRRRRSFKT